MSSYAEKGKAVRREPPQTAGESSTPRQADLETSSSGSETQFEQSLGFIALNRILADTREIPGVSGVTVCSPSPQMASTITQILRGELNIRETQNIWPGPSRTYPSAPMMTDIQKITEIFTRVDQLTIQLQDKNEPYRQNQTRVQHADMFMRVLQARLVEAEKKQDKARVQGLKKQLIHFERQKSESQRQMHEWDVGGRTIWDTVSVEVEALKNLAIELEAQLSPATLKIYVRHLRTTLDKFGRNVNTLRQTKHRWHERTEELRLSLISLLPSDNSMWDRFLEAAARIEQEIFHEDTSLRQAETLIATYEESEQQLQRLEAKSKRSDDWLGDRPLADLDLPDLENVIRVATLEPRRPR